MLREFADEHLEAVSEVVLHGIYGQGPGNIVVGSVGVLFGIFVAAQQRRHCFPERGRAKWIERVGHQACKHHRTAYGQWSPCPPQVQGADMPVPNGLVAHAFGGDFLDGQGYFY